MKKKIVSIILATCLAVGLLSGCGKKTADVSSESQDSANTQTSDAEETADAKADEEASQEEKQYTLEDIAELNGLSVDELNVGYDKDGYINFIGNTFCEDKITDDKSAKEALNKVSTLLCLDEVSLELIRTDVSPTTKATYYTYSQVVSTQENSGNDMELFGNGIVKVIADKDGNAAGVSLYVEHGELMDFDADRMFSKEEAEQMVQDMYEGVHVYTEATKCIYWSDDDVASYVGSEGSIVPVWVVYIDAPSKENGLSMDIAKGATLTDGSTECCPYLELVIPAVREEGSNENAIVASYYTNNIENTNDLVGNYASNEFFDSKEDAGEVTLEMDLAWVKEVYPDYKGEMTSTVTVPIMYDKELDQYVIGDKNELLTVGNFHDFIQLGTYEVNPLVSKTPEDVNSWHFLKDGKDTIGREYFCNPNYVIASFDAYRKVYLAYKEQYGLNSYDTSGMPLLLLAYGYFDASYPEDVDSFPFNATNGGQRADWGVFVTSPACAECLGMVTMFHEYTHGINGCLTKSHYFNEAGAVMEGYADILGVLMAQKYGGKAEDDWECGGEYADVARDPANPRDYRNPQVIDDIFYIAAIDPIFDCIGLADDGGVHDNSGVLNYYAYRLREPGNLLDNESALTLDESINLWYECLFMSNYESGFSDAARYNMLSAKLLGLSDDKVNLMSRIIDENGLIDREPAKELLYSGVENYKMTFEFEKSSMDEDLCFFGATVGDIGQLVFGGDVDNVISGSVPGESELDWFLFIGDKTCGQVITQLSPFSGFSDHNITMTVKDKVLAKVGDTVTMPEGEEIVMLNNSQAEFIFSLRDNGENTFNEPGYYVFVTKPADADSADALAMYIYEVTE